MSNVPLNSKGGCGRTATIHLGRSTAIDGLGRPRKARVANRGRSRGISRALLYFVLVLGAILCLSLHLDAGDLAQVADAVYQNSVQLIPPLLTGGLPTGANAVPILAGLENTLIITAE